MTLQNKKAKSLLLQYIIGEVCIIMAESIIFFLLKWDNRFAECICFSAYLASVATMSYLGIEVFDALVKSEWRHRIANYQYYPIYQAFILIAINAIICPILSHNERWYVVYVFPVCIWIGQIIISTLYKLFRGY